MKAGGSGDEPGLDKKLLAEAKKRSLGELTRGLLLRTMKRKGPFVLATEDRNGKRLA